MKKSVVLALALAIGLSACAKKNPVPGSPSDERKSEINKPLNIPASERNEANALVGVYESACEKESVMLEIDGGEMDEFKSYRRILTIDEFDVVEQHVRFSGEQCDGDVRQVGNDEVWAYSILKAGAVNGSPFELRMVTDDVSYMFEIDAHLTKPEGGKETIQFGADPEEIPFVRR